MIEDQGKSGGVLRRRGGHGVGNIGEGFEERKGKKMSALARG